MRSLASNAVANVVQMVIGAVLLFALYRYINIALGVEQLGVWSVVLATVSASRIAELGLSAGVTRFVARDLGRGELSRAVQVIDTVTLTLMVLMAMLLLLLYPLLAGLMPKLFDAALLIQSLEILPYALVSLWLTSLASVFQGGLDSCQRMDLRAGLVVIGQVLLLANALWLVPQHGLLGLAWAQISQGLFLAVAGRVLLRLALPQLSWMPCSWSRYVLREMLGYGANVQFATLFMLVYDPLAKMLMASFGGAAAAGYFEMANQVVLKVRSVIVAANQAIVPYVATLAESEPALLPQLYNANIRALAIVTLPTFALLITWAGGVSWLLVGAYKEEFVFQLGILAMAWAVNIFASPAYFINMGVGRVGCNTLSQVIMGTLNASLGWMLGYSYGAKGVLFAYVIALITGSWVLIFVFRYRNHLVWRGVLAREHSALAIAGIVVIAFGWLFPLNLTDDNSITLMTKLFLSPLVLGLAAWFHPMRRQFLGCLMRGRLERETFRAFDVHGTDECR